MWISIFLLLNEDCNSQALLFRLVYCHACQTLNDAKDGIIQTYIKCIQHTARTAYFRKLTNNSIWTQSVASLKVVLMVKLL
jgi:hypothetical protein